MTQSQTGAPSLSRLPPYKSGSSESYVSASSSVASAATVVFKIHLVESHLDSAEAAKLVEWLHSLNENIDLELSEVYESNSSSVFTLQAP